MVRKRTKFKEQKLAKKSRKKGEPNCEPHLKPLTKLQKGYVQYKLAHPNCSQYEAYLNAGGKSRDVAGRIQAHHVHNMPNVQYRLQQQENKRIKRYQEKGDITFEWVIEHLKAIVDFDVRNLFNFDNHIKNLWELDDITAKAISVVEFNFNPKNKDPVTGEEKDIKMNSFFLKKLRTWDKLKALELIIELMRFKETYKSSEEDIQNTAMMIRDQAEQLFNSVPLHPEDYNDDKAVGD